MEYFGEWKFLNLFFCKMINIFGKIKIKLKALRKFIRPPYCTWGSRGGVSLTISLRQALNSLFSPDAFGSGWSCLELRVRLCVCVCL